MFRSLLIVLVVQSPLVAAGPVTAFQNATIYTVIGEPIVGGTLLVADGKVVAVGKNIAIPQGATVVDVKGAVIIPGIVDTHSHVGIFGKPSVAAHADGNEMSGPVQSAIRAIDAIDPNDPGIRMALAGGITTANVMPGSGNVIGGQTLYVKFRGNTVEQMRILGKRDDGVEVLGGLKMANGENPKGYGKRGQAPFTRMKVAALQREQFLKAKEYQAKMKSDKKPDRDLGLESLVEVLEKTRTVHFHSHRADDLMTAVRIAEEFGFELVLQHCTEGYRVADELAKRKIPCSLTLVDSPGGKAEVIGLLEENAAILDKAGVPVSINTDDYITESRFILGTGAIAVRGGMSEAAALKALTINPANVMHLAHRVGSLEVGKDADFVILDGPAFSTYTKVLQTWIEGTKVFDAADAKDRTYRDGGLWLPSPSAAPAMPKLESLPKVDRNTGKPENPANPKQTWVFGDRIHTAAGNVLMNGVVILENGRIKSIEPDAKRLAVPKDAATYYASDITPGLIDPHTVAGLSGAWNIAADQDQDEVSDPDQSDLRALDSFNPNEPLMEFLRANGVTTIHASPGRAVVIAGQSGVFRTVGGTVLGSTLKPVAGLLVNLGESPKDAFKEKGPKTRMAVAAVVRKAFAEAQAYKQRPADSPKGRSTKSEALLPALAGDVPVYFAAHRSDDILTALRISDEFKLKPVLVLATDAYLIADELAKHNVPVIVHPTTQRPGAMMETRNTFLGNAAFLKAKGIPVTICTCYESYVPKQRNLRHEAAMAAANGLGHDGALRAITIDAAKLLGIDKDYGSLEVGKVADLVLYDADPFEHATHVTRTFMNGRVVYDRDEYLRLPIERRALTVHGGGPGAGCCLGEW
jgi:imidazolonepropionase-like amidohydrolase